MNTRLVLNLSLLTFTCKLTLAVHFSTVIVCFAARSTRHRMTNSTKMDSLNIKEILIFLLYIDWTHIFTYVLLTALWGVGNKTFLHTASLIHTIALRCSIDQHICRSIYHVWLDEIFDAPSRRRWVGNLFFLLLFTGTERGGIPYNIKIWINAVFTDRVCGS